MILSRLPVCIFHTPLDNATYNHVVFLLFINLAASPDAGRKKTTYPNDKRSKTTILKYYVPENLFFFVTQVLTCLTKSNILIKLN